MEPRGVGGTSPLPHPHWSQAPEPASTSCLAPTGLTPALDQTAGHPQKRPCPDLGPQSHHGLFNCRQLANKGRPYRLTNSLNVHVRLWDCIGSSNFKPLQFLGTLPCSGQKSSSQSPTLPATHQKKPEEKMRFVP